MRKAKVAGSGNKVGKAAKRSSLVDYLADLNKQQRRAVEHGITGKKADDQRPLLVLAGAGSGKTKTLATRLAHLLANGADPNRVMLLTFTRLAADEMGRRVERIASVATGVSRIDLPWSGTFHSVGSRLLRRYGRLISIDPDFTVIDRPDSQDLMNMVRTELGFSKTKERFPQKATCLEIYSMCINCEMPLLKVLRQIHPDFVNWRLELKKLFREYEGAKRRANVFDFDDVLSFWAEMMEDAQIAPEIQKQFDFIFVDEYQDTNRLQSRILKGLKPNGNGLMVVGDDAQAIFGFRGSTVRNILDFPSQFEPKARIIKLEQNYRSTQPILEACNAVIGLATEGYPKNLFSKRKSKQLPRLTTVDDEAAQARYIAKRVLKAREEGIPLTEQAVLFRSSSHSLQLELELGRRNIPFKKFGGLKFIETAHVKDVLAILRWSENSRDQLAVSRVVQLLPGIGPAAAKGIADAQQQSQDPVSALAGYQVPKAAADHWPKLVALMEKLLRGGKNWPASFDLARRWYEPHLQRNHDDAQVRSADLEQLGLVASGYTSRQQFLTELMLDPPNATAGKAKPGMEDEDEYLTLSTIHSAKGREWRNVTILTVVDGSIPSSRSTKPAAIEEERRLLYVAMSRAKDDLDLVFPLRYYTRDLSQPGDRYGHASISRFIPDHVRKHFERKRWGSRNPSGSSGPQGSIRKKSKVDMSAKLMRRWR